MDTQKALKPPPILKVLLWYSIVLIIVFILSIIANNMIFNETIIFIATTLVFILEIVIGMIAAGSVGLLSSFDSIRARGEPISGKTVLKQRIRDEEQSYRKIWFILLIINSIVLVGFFSLINLIIP